MNTKIFNKLKQLKSILNQQFGIEEFAVFGSFAREEETNQSDIDLVILKSTKKDYFKRIGAKYLLEKELNKKVDIGYFDSIRPFLQKRIKKDLVYV